MIFNSSGQIKNTTTQMETNMRILVCPSGFKGSLQPDTAADCIEAGILLVDPTAKVKKVPLVDGGEGFTRALVNITGGSIHKVSVTGPVGKPVMSFFGMLGPNEKDSRKTAVIEMAAAAGLTLVPKDCRNPGVTTTYGVGQLILAAIDAGATRILVGCSDSGTCDAGAGMLQALGAVLWNKDGSLVPNASGGESLIHFDAIDLSNVDPRVFKTEIDVAVNWHNILCGSGGVAAVFGPQKGATEAQIQTLSIAMEAMAKVATAVLVDGRNPAVPLQSGNEIPDLRLAPGGGASGGLGTGLRLIGANLRPRYEVIMEYIDLDSLFDDCDLVVTAEGGLDDQTPRGKIPAEIAQRAKKHRLPVIAIAGTIGPGARLNYDAGIDAFTCILQRPMTLDDAVCEAEKLTIESAECVMRIVTIGRMLGLANIKRHLETQML